SPPNPSSAAVDTAAPASHLRLHLPDVGLDAAWPFAAVEAAARAHRATSDATTAATTVSAAAASEKPPPPQQVFLSEAARAALAPLLADAGVRHDDASQRLPAALAVLHLYFSLCPSLPPLELSIRSALPIGAGLGSSASYSVCIAAGMLVLGGHLDARADFHHDGADDEGNGRPATAEAAALVNDWAFVSETVLHGNPSGVDNSVCCFGGARAYAKGQPLRAVPGFSSMRFIVTDTRHPKNTKAQVAGVRRRLDAFPRVVPHLLDAVQGVADSFLDLFARADAGGESKADVDREMETLVEMNHGALVALGVSHASLERVRAATAPLGLASKLTGAGGGGCAITFVPS
ncbi:hypothetical protein HK405_013698, partial [Cladochytrium tenue]